MYRDVVFSEIRNELIAKLQQIELSDFENFYEWAMPHFKLLKRLADLKDLAITDEKTFDKEEEKVTEGKNAAKEKSQSEEDLLPYPLGRIFTVNKKALGAVVAELNYPIPEALLREMNIENGNKVKIVGSNGVFPNGSPKWIFEVVDTTSVPVPDLVEISQGIVKNISHALVITETVGGGTIWVNDLPATLYINETDAIKHNIKDGDIVDGRFYANNVTGTFRVNYKHQIEESALIQSIESRKLQYRKNNTNETQSGISMLERLDTQPFLNRHIVLVGLESRKNDFAANLKRVGDIQLTHLTGDENKRSIRAILKKADYVLISTLENSHDASKYTAKTCKELDVPCTYTHADGLCSILMDVLDLIRYKDDQAV